MSTLFVAEEHMTTHKITSMSRYLIQHNEFCFLLQKAFKLVFSEVAELLSLREMAFSNSDRTWSYFIVSRGSP